MKLITPPLIIEEGTDFEKDLFDRKNFGHSLANIIKQCQDPLVIGLDGNWGEGKTTFIQMWKGLLKKEQIHSIYIDAFANDHTDDAFIVVASAIHDYVQSHADTSTTTTLIEKIKKTGVKLIPWTAKLALKAASIGIIKDADFDEFKEIAESVSSDISETAENLIHEKLVSHKQNVQTIESFKEFLSTLPSLLNKPDTTLPLTIIIDELDRCRPSFAIELLEKIKHLFSVPNVVFVLVMNKQQLEESIRSMYGANIDAHTYLQKFITIEAQLPKQQDKYNSDIGKYCERLHYLHELEVNSYFITPTMKALGEHFNLTLRQLEKIYSNLTLAYGSSRSPNNQDHALLAFGATLKVIHTKLFKSLNYREISYDELCIAINYRADDKDDERVDLYNLMMHVKYCVISDQEYADLKEDRELRRFEVFGRTTRYHTLLRAFYPLTLFNQN